MATTIKSTESGRIFTAELIDAKSGGNMLSDIMAVSGIEYSLDDAAEFEVPTDAEAEWWVHWAETEPRIWEARENADDATKAEDDRLIGAYGHDMEELQRRECELFGIDCE